MHVIKIKSLHSIHKLTKFKHIQSNEYVQERAKICCVSTKREQANIMLFGAHTNALQLNRF